MARFLLGTVCFLGLAFAVGCTEHKKTYYEVSRLQSQWGAEYSYRSILATSAQTRSLGSAVAVVERMSGTVGTGFFISADGLFLTNQHVIPRDICNQSRCQGIRLVRDESPGGAYEIYYDFDVVAQDPTYDFTLLKVQLPEGETVPFLRIKTDMNEEELTAVKKPNGRFMMLGHPSASSLQAAPVVIAGVNQNVLVFKGIYIGGNSGGPLVDTASGEAIAIGRSSSFGEVKGEHGFSIEVDNQATPLVSILHRLSLLTDEHGDEDPARFLASLSRSYKDIQKSELFDVWVKSNLLPERSIKLEEALAKLTQNREFLTSFDAFFLNSNLEAEALRAAFPIDENLSRDRSELIDTSNKMFLLSLTSNEVNRPLRLSEPQYENLIYGRRFFVREDVPIDQVQAAEADSIKRLSDCNFDSKMSPTDRLIEYFQCAPNPEVLQGILREILAGDKADGAVGAALTYGLLGRPMITSQEQAAISDFGLLYINKTRELAAALRMDGLVHRLDDRPALLLRGSWREPLPVKY